MKSAQDDRQPNYMETELITIEVEKIRPGDNDRKRFDPAEIDALAESIAAHGLAQPTIVRATVAEIRWNWGKLRTETVPVEFEIVAGERRFRALKKLGRRTIRAAIIPADVEILVRDMSDESTSALMLAENTARVDLRPTEEARAYQKRIAAGESVDDVARSAGVSRWTVSRRLRLLDLPDFVRHWVDQKAPDNLPLAFAEIMEGLSPAQTQTAFQLWVRSGRGISRGSFARAVDKLKAQGEQDGFDFDDFFQLVEEAPEIRLTDPVVREIRDLVAFVKMDGRQRARWIKKNPKAFERVVAWLKWKGVEI